jgi:glycyl-tRNA synthetase
MLAIPTLTAEDACSPIERNLLTNLKSSRGTDEGSLMDLYDKLSELGKRRGIVFPSFEIYGGVGGFYDYGPVGTLIKHNIEDKWRRLFVQREGMVEIESTTVPEVVFEASGHLSHFTDIMTRCTRCGRAYRTDHLIRELGAECPEGLSRDDLDRLVEASNVHCPECGGALGKSEPFNLMFQVSIGSHGGSIKGYGRPEAAQGQFLDFPRIYASERERLPLGIAQVGRVLRNEIAPRKGPIRLREYTIIDYEIFLDPEDPIYPNISLLKDQRLRILTIEEQRAKGDKVVEMSVQEALEKGVVRNEILCYFMALAVGFIQELGIPWERQRIREALPEERAHYSSQTFDQEVWLERWGWTELSGHAYRTDYDLRNHMMHSGVDMRVHKPLGEPRTVRQIRLEPNRDTLEADFGKEQAGKIVVLLERSDPAVVERELREKGIYEVTGQSSVWVGPRHIKVTYQDILEKGRSFIPHVVEPSFGVDRITYAVLEYAYKERDKRVLLEVPRDIAATKVAVFPLVNRDGLPDKARKIVQSLLAEELTVSYDASGSIGRRYARADEVGIPICLTVDYRTLEDSTVTLRDLYTWKQVRSQALSLPEQLREYLRCRREFSGMGSPVPEKPGANSKMN